MCMCVYVCDRERERERERERDTEREYGIEAVETFLVDKTEPTSNMHGDKIDHTN